MEISENDKERFIRELEKLGLDDPMLEFIYDMMVKENIPSYSWEIHRDHSGDKMSCLLHLRSDERKLPYLAGYRATLRKVDPIPHGVYEGIDTSELENRMREIDWSMNITEKSPDGSKVLAAIPEIYGTILQLNNSKDDRAGDVADRLQVKYWVETQMEKHIYLDILRTRFEKNHYFEIKGDMDDVSERQAYNLMCNRPVLMFKHIQPGLFATYWLKLRPLKALKVGKYFDEVQVDDFDIGNRLRELPILEMSSARSGAALIRQLSEGDLTFATLRADGKEIPVCLVANPEKGSVNVYDSDVREMDMDKLIQSDKIAGKKKPENKAAVKRKKQNGKEENRQRDAKPKRRFKP